jgi:hypothetical protein
MIREHQWIARWRGRGHLGVDGSVAVELGLLAPIVVPFLLTLALGIADLGIFFNYSEALQMATRIGAEYARSSGTCQSGIDLLASPPTISSACVTNIKDAMNRSLNYGAGQLTFPANFSLSCYCDDGNSITCGNSSCATADRPGPNRVFIAVSASQSYSPMISWGGLFPTDLAAVTEMRLQ